jgi:uncharacterized repeat protein (TIGR03803 family)
VSGNVLYGTTRDGGSNFDGTVFALKTDGTGFTNLHVFSALVSNTNADGASPEAGLVLSGNTLYGTAYYGGRYGEGTVFAVNTNGTGFTNLFSFNGANGQNPEAALIVSGNTLYGTTYLGGSSGDNTNGTVFAINTDGTGFTNLHSFTALGSLYPTNSDGANPESGLVLSGSTLYGAAARGGSSGFGYGTIFALNADGTGFTNLFYFDASNGAFPYSDLLLIDNTLYGTTSGGGANFAGTVFKINTDGGGFVDLHDFLGAGYNGSAYTNGTGAEPWAGLVASGSTLFGVTPTGGTGGVGTVYALTLPATASIPLNAQLTGGLLVLSWTNTAFSLQGAPNLGSSFIDVPGAGSPYTVFPTNSQQFFRLQAN